MAVFTAVCKQKSSTVAKLSDEDIFPEDSYTNLYVNNYFVRYENLEKTVDNTLLEILKHHPLHYAITVTRSVPIVYLQQFWNTMTLETTEDGEVFTATIERHKVSFDISSLREILHLDYTDKFVAQHSSKQLISDFLKMGYKDASMNLLSKFSRVHVPGIWYNLYGVMAKSLCPSGSGLDKAVIDFLHMFHGFCFCQQIDYAQHIWNILRESVLRRIAGKGKQFVAYSRFLAVVIGEFMDRFPAISSRSSSPMFHPTVIKFQLTGKTDKCMPIPQTLLALVGRIQVTSPIKKSRTPRKRTPKPVVEKAQAN